MNQFLRVKKYILTTWRPPILLTWECHQGHWLHVLALKCSYQGVFEKSPHRDSSLLYLFIYVCFLSLRICLFYTFHMSRIVGQVAFCVWRLSLSTSIMFWRFVHVVACVGTLFLFMEIFYCSYITICVCIHLLMDMWDVSTIWLLRIMLL